MTDFAILVLASYPDCVRLAVSIIIPYPYLPAFSPTHDPRPEGGCKGGMMGCFSGRGKGGEEVCLFSHLP